MNLGNAGMSPAHKGASRTSETNEYLFLCNLLNCLSAYRTFLRMAIPQQKIATHLLYMCQKLFPKFLSLDATDFFADQCSFEVGCIRVFSLVAFPVCQNLLSSYALGREGNQVQ